MFSQVIMTHMYPCSPCYGAGGDIALVLYNKGEFPLNITIDLSDVMATGPLRVGSLFSIAPAPPPQWAPSTALQREASVTSLPQVKSGGKAPPSSPAPIGGVQRFGAGGGGGKRGGGASGGGAKSGSVAGSGATGRKYAAQPRPGQRFVAQTRAQNPSPNLRGLP